MSSASVGSISWLKETNGSLLFREKMSILFSVILSSAKQKLKRSSKLNLVGFDDVQVPDSQAVKHALAELESCANSSVIQHSLRTYYWAAGLGKGADLNYDPEFLLVACLLHDLGMTEAYRGQTCDCFAGASAEAAAKVMEEFPWPTNKVVHLSEAICLHMNGFSSNKTDVEARLLQQGAACDIVGERFFELDESYRQTIIQRYPRHNINEVFDSFIMSEANQYPKSRAALMHRVGLAGMIKANPFTD